MYTEFYNLETLPFQLSPDHRFFFGSSVHNSAMAHLTYGLSQGEGFLIITGDVGAGKTTLVGHLLSNLDLDTFIVAKIVTTHLDPDNMLRMVASSFGLRIEGVDKASLLSSLETFLQSAHDNGKRALLIVDEAQNLTVSSVEELRMLSNFQIGVQTPLQCILLGQPEFRETLASPDLEQLRQRVIASYHLGPLSKEETRSYIQHRLQLAGWKNDPEIAEEAYVKVFDYTDGVPRMINVLCSRILLYGYLEEIHHISGEIVEQVAEEHRNENRQISVEDKRRQQQQSASPEPEEAVDPVVLAPTVAAAPEPLPASADGDSAGDQDMAVVAGNDDAVATPVVAAEPSEGRLSTDDLEEVLLRLDVLEDYARMHSRIMKKVLRLAEDQFEGRNEDVRTSDTVRADRGAGRPAVATYRSRTSRRRRRFVDAHHQRDDG